MKVAIEWIASYFVYSDAINWDLVWSKLTNAGIEIESVEHGVVDLKITPNRADCLGVEGIVDEIALLTGYKLHAPLLRDLVYTNRLPATNLLTKGTLKVTNSAVDKCSAYHLVHLKNIDNQVTLPKFLSDRLTLSGLSSVNPVVDILNYVMLMCNQPLHAYNAHALQSTDGLTSATSLHIDIQSINSSNALGATKLLNGNTVVLDIDTLAIVHDTQVIALAGIMGSDNSKVLDNTTEIYVEAACFAPIAVANIAKHYAINSEAAYRFERGVDPSSVVSGLQIALDLLATYCHAQIVDYTCTSDIKTQQSIGVIFSYDKIRAIIGYDGIDNNCIDQYFQQLRFRAVGNTVYIPNYRFDITTQYDLAEEVARLYGYDNLPSCQIVANVCYDENILNHCADVGGSAWQQLDYEYSARCALTSFGFTETINYAFVEDKYVELNDAFAKFFSIGAAKTLQAVVLQNSIANLNTMRSSIVAGPFKVVMHKCWLWP